MAKTPAEQSAAKAGRATLIAELVAPWCAARRARIPADELRDALEAAHGAVTELAAKPRDSTKAG